MRISSRLFAVLTAIVALPLIVSPQSSAPLDLAVEYRDVARRLIDAAIVDTGGHNKLAYLTTRIGHRLSGSPGLERAVAWVAEQMKADGLENVRTQPVKVPYWVRGNESAQVVKPVERSIGILGLGRSIATPPEGITAPVVVVSDFDELDRLGTDAIKGKIVLFDMAWRSYGETVEYRRSGASRAARLGAVAALVRSVTPRSLYTPHTGSLTYEAGTPRIPAAAITVEDAAWIRQMTAMGQQVQVRLHMEAETRADADSANVMGEIAGRERPDEIVVMGGHLDSWDVGQGAHDDGAGVLAAWQAVVLMKQLGLRPRRTIRVVAWTNEENGALGAAAYRDALGADVGRHVAAIEMDSGAERPIGFAYAIEGLANSDPRALNASARLREIARLLEGIEANALVVGADEVDIRPLMRAGVPGFGLLTVNERYFDWHHTNADTFDKIDLQDFRKCIAAMAVMGYVLADMPGRL